MRLIDADVLIQKRNHAKAYAPDMYVIGQGYVMDAPTIDAAPGVRGEWVAFDPLNTERPYNWVCSNCGYGCVDYRTAYCHDCGAKMEAQNE